MVQILIKMPGEKSEWGMIELQGTLETKDGVGFNGLYIGDLHFDDKGVPNLIVGHHLLVGKVIELDKPFAVIRKGLTDRRYNIEDEMMETEEEKMEVDKMNDHPETPSYNIVAIIKWKIIFKNRPRPIITNSSSTL